VGLSGGLRNSPIYYVARSQNGFKAAVFDEAAALRPWTEKRRDIEVGAGLSHLAEMKGWLVKS